MVRPTAQPALSLLLTTLLMSVLAGCESTPPDDGPMGMDSSSWRAPIELIPEAIGTRSWAITTRSSDAQAYFDQGMALRWAYNVNEAARSMREARSADPACAMCWWGEAFALGSFLNGGMSKEKSADAHAAIVEAHHHAGAATAVEQALIRAALTRYPADYDPAARREVDKAFADAMRGVYEAYPNHHDVAVVYAVALFMLEERRGNRDLDDPDVQRLHGVLTGVLDDDIRHPGACHLYIHATESTTNPGLALPCAEYLSETIPVASHIQHMPSHTWNEVGMWHRSVRANVEALKSDRRARDGQGFSYGAIHNLHMLLFAASYDGQGAAATQAGRDFRKLSDNAMYEALTLLRFGRFDEILELDERPEYDIGAALWDFAQGYASLRMGDRDRAIRMRDACLTFATTTEATFRFHPARHVVGPVAHILAGEIERADGNLTAAIASFREAARIEDEMEYDEPEPLPFAARHWLGAALLESGNAADAEVEYRIELADHPHDVWSLTGLQRALDAQGRSDPAVAEDLRAGSARVDHWFDTSRF